MAGTWSCTGAPSGSYPTEDLFQIIRYARVHHPALYEALVIDEATTCALSHAAADGGGASSHCDYVLTARDYAVAANWSHCIKALKHLGPVSPGTPIAPAFDWPCDTGTATCDADVSLFTVIQLANFGAGLDRETVIDLALICALDHDVNTGPGYATAADHCAWATKAQGHAEAGDWALCIEALEHVGGGVADPGATTDDPQVALDALLTRLRKELRRWWDSFGA